MSKLRFFNIFFLKPGLTKKFHFYKGPPILTRWRCLLYARNLQFGLLSSDEFLLRKWFSQIFCKNMFKNLAKPLFDEAAPIFLKIILKFSGIKQTAPSSENWRSFIKWNFLVRPGLRKKMLRNLSFDINWDPFSVVIGGCWEFLSNKNCSLKDALQLGQTRFWFRPPKNCLGFKPVVHYPPHQPLKKP